MKTSKREPKTRTKRDENGDDTYPIPLRLFRAGFSVDEIVTTRGMSKQTIEAHLARFVSSGEIRLEELVPADKIEAIRSAIIRFNDGGALSPVKEFLGDDYSYGEIKAVIAAMHAGEQV